MAVTRQRMACGRDGFGRSGRQGAEGAEAALAQPKEVQPWVKLTAILSHRPFAGAAN
jgi:hypothetical protein